jgi:DMSO/TMAO reductase YedYZ molybdopterin-dependent catalytic subunit
MTNAERADQDASPTDEAWAPTPLQALGLPEIPSERHFLRSHFPVPPLDGDAWALQVVGADGHFALTLDALRALHRRTLRVVLECAGHRRAEMSPLPPGVPWACGAVAEASWTGASLGVVLRGAGVPAGAVEVVLEGADAGEFEGLPGTHRFARSLPLSKALDRDVLLAYEMNGQPIPVDRGGPVRVIVPGWYATDSVKWLDRAWFAFEPFDGAFQAHDYRWREPGEQGPGRRMTELPIHALITAPSDRQQLSAGPCVVRGTAWSGRHGVESVYVQLDEQPWSRARLESARGRFARAFWELDCTLTPSVHRLACRAFDRDGTCQPDAPLPNVGGYANNSVHCVQVSVR